MHFTASRNLRTIFSETPRITWKAFES